MFVNLNAGQKATLVTMIDILWVKRILFHEYNPVFYWLAIIKGKAIIVLKEYVQIKTTMENKLLMTAIARDL
jgi:uncharacterized membrane-anchored protein